MYVRLTESLFATSCRQFSGKSQAVRFTGKLYVMTRMGFGLNGAPKMMSSILAKALSMNDLVS